MGTWQAGKKMWVGIEDAETTKRHERRLRLALLTAEVGEGHSSEIVAQALSDVETRWFATKVLPIICNMTR